MTKDSDGSIVCPMAAVYTTPAKLRPVKLWRLPLQGAGDAYAVLAPTAASSAVVCYLVEQLQDAAQFPDREAALAWAEDVREMRTAPVRGWRRISQPGVAALIQIRTTTVRSGVSRFVSRRILPPTRFS
jgi:hypothetical protein